MLSRNEYRVSHDFIFCSVPSGTIVGVINTTQSLSMSLWTRLGITVLLQAATVTAVSIPGYQTTYDVVKPGGGSEVVAKGSTVTVHATGIVVETDKKFWSTKDAGQKPFTYQAGVGRVITGWDQVRDPPQISPVN